MSRREPRSLPSGAFKIGRVLRRGWRAIILGTRIVIRQIRTAPSWLVIAAGIAALAWLVLAGGPWLLTLHPSYGMHAGEVLKAQNDVRTTLVQAVAGLAVAGGLAVTYRTYRLNQSQQVTDIFTKAVEQLGHPKAPVRHGGKHSAAASIFTERDSWGQQRSEGPNFPDARQGVERHFTEKAFFSRATFTKQAWFGDATFTDGVTFENSKVFNLDDSKIDRRWPDGWTVRNEPDDPTQGTVVQESAPDQHEP